MELPSARIHAFAWLRGLAALVMIQTHALALLRPAARSHPLFQSIIFVDGLVAPTFIFGAGFALALVQTRAGLTGNRWERCKKSLWRIAEVLLVATLVNIIWFPVLREPKWLLRIDILHCIGLSLLLAMPVLVGLSTRPRLVRWVLLLMGLGLFAVAPFAEQATGPLQLFLNNRPGVLDETTGATFPLLPWSGYLFLGASVGATVGAMRAEGELWAWLALLLSIGSLLWWNKDEVNSAYPAHQFWLSDPGSAALRWSLVVLLVALLRLLEKRCPASVQTGLARWLEAFGASSLSAYFFHEMLLFERHIGVLGHFFREKADWPLYWVLVAGLSGATWGCIKVWQRVDTGLRARWAARKDGQRRLPRWPSFLFLFLGSAR